MTTVVNGNTAAACAAEAWVLERSPGVEVGVAVGGVIEEYILLSCDLKSN